jgi:6-phosphogluconolactonase (cycloisomerase 2 family)
MNRTFLTLAALSPVLIASCSSSDDDNSGTPSPPEIVGGVFAMTNGEGQPSGNGDIAGPNSVVAYSRAEDGTLTLVGSYPTAGNGGDFDGGEGLDPLISANAVQLTPDNTRLLAVNAGSNTISSFAVNADMSLTMMSQMLTGGTGPNAIATDGDRVFVTNIDADGVFTGEPDQEGSVTSFLIDAAGILTPTGSSQDLENRPSDVRLSSNGGFIIISSLTAGSAGLPNDSIVNENTETDGPDEIVVHAVDANGVISARAALGSAISSFRDIRDNDGAAFQGPDEMGADPVGTATGNYRNLPSPIGMSVVASGTAGFDIVLATETREFNAFGGGPTLPNLEAGSISTFLLNNSTGEINPIAGGTDIAASLPGEPNQLTLCWVASAEDGTGGQVVYVSNTINSLISSFAVDGDGAVTVIERIAAAGNGPFADGEDNTTIVAAPGMSLGETVFGNTDGYIDMALSADNDYLYQLTGLSGSVVVYRRNGDNTLTQIQVLDAETADGEGEIPTQNSQGIDAF